MGVLRSDSLNRGDLQLHSVLEISFVSFSNLSRLNIEAAARLYDRKQGVREVINLSRYIAEADAGKGAAMGQGGLGDRAA